MLMSDMVTSILVMSHPAALSVRANGASLAVNISKLATSVKAQLQRRLPITSHLTCKSSWLIYLITCKKCTKQYIGKTETALNLRFNNTRSEIKKKNHNTKGGKSLPYVSHFNLQQHSVDYISFSCLLNKSTKRVALLSCEENHFGFLNFKLCALMASMLSNNQFLLTSLSPFVSNTVSHITVSLFVFHSFVLGKKTFCWT